MDIDRFIKQDMIEFLEKEIRKDISVQNIRPDEMTLYEIDKDYVELLEEQLKMNNIESARGLFDELRKTYNRTTEASPIRKKIFSILKEMHDLLKKYIKEHKVQNQITFEIQYYDQKGFFIQNQLPKKIQTEDEEKFRGKGGEDESYNLLKDTLHSIGGRDGQQDLAELVTQDIQRSIPLEESAPLRNIFSKSFQKATAPEVIIEQIESPAIAQEVGKELKKAVQEPPAKTSSPPKPQTPSYQPISREEVRTIVEKTIEKEQPVVKEVIREESKKPIQVYIKPEDFAKAGASQKDAIKKIVQDATKDYLKKEQKKGADVKKEILRQEAEQQDRIKTEKDNLKKKQEELAIKIEELKKLRLYKEELDLVREKEKKEEAAHIIDTIITARKSIHANILARDYPKAKRAYRSIKKAFEAMPNCEEKKAIYKEILATYDSIRYAEQESRRMKPHEELKEAIAHLKMQLMGIKRSIYQGRYAEAEDGLQRISAYAQGIKDPTAKDMTIEVIKNYQARVKSLKDSTIPSGHEKIVLSGRIKGLANMYMQGVNLLYSDRKDEAAGIFRKILAQNPNNIAAKIRLREATG
ncbi:MAG: hypothetical protein ABIJ21_05250 [Nanoarchaeota archaeon]